MNAQKLTRIYMVAVLVSGMLCVLSALVNLPLHLLDIQFLLLFGLTIGVGSRITVQIPRLKSHIAVSDTFIFLVLLIYGGEVAIVVAAVEAFFSSLRFCKKKLTILFNVSAMALSTAAVFIALKSFGLYSESQLHGRPGNVSNFVIVLSVLALTQFIVNTSLVSIYDSFNNSIPLWETWKSKYIWTFFTYFIGAAGAGILVQLSDNIGFGIILGTFPVIFFVFLTYRMYLKNVEMSILQAEQAKEYAQVLEVQSHALRESEERFRSAFDHAPIGIAMVSPEGRWIKVNHALTEILGYSADEFLSMDFQSMIFPSDLGSTLVKIHELTTGKIGNCQMEQRYLDKTGQIVWTLWSVSAASVVNTDGSNLIFQLQDITDKKLSEQKLRHDATHDSLTGLPNRAYFMSQLSKALLKARRNPKYSVCILFIDLDRFKYVNDSLGHFIGDELLIAIANRLRDCMRPPDIVTRFGGDEFTILVEGRYYTEKATRIAERVQQKFSEPFAIHEHIIYSSASIGILHASENHRNAEEMIRDADTAMYHAKRGGKARHMVFDENMHTEAREALQLETDLRSAVAKDEMKVFYQPIFDLGKNIVIGVEALARWDHPEMGDISPERFIALAEEIGCIDVLGQHILRKACSEIGTMYKSLGDKTELSLSVNLSCKQFAAADLVERIKSILNETGFAPQKLRLEITESVFIEYQEKAIGMLDELRTFGIDIEIDDFGTGYSNLSYLVRLPISSFKIDRSFISQIDGKGTNTEIVGTILALAENLGLNVIAEGIETETQLETLKSLGCERGQGFLLGRPMNLTELGEFLKSEPFLRVPDESEINDVSIISMLQ